MTSKDIYIVDLTKYPRFFNEIQSRLRPLQTISAHTIKQICTEIDVEVEFRVTFGDKLWEVCMDEPTLIWFNLKWK